MLFYRRNLPHWHPEGAALFLTWRLYGSLPASYNTAKIGCATDSPGQRFKRLDAVLDKAATGPLWLNDPRIALCVVGGIHTGHATLGF
jgi:putative transposase